jgi:hypothetical protein
MEKERKAVQTADSLRRLIETKIELEQSVSRGQAVLMVRTSSGDLARVGNLKPDKSAYRATVVI